MFKTSPGTVVLLVFFLISAALLTSCNKQVSKGEVYQTLIRDIRPGEDKADVIRYLDGVSVNGVKPTSSGYLRAASPYLLPVADGKEVEVAGEMSISFDNGISAKFGFCPVAFAIFYFDKDDRLITYIIDC